VTAVCTGDTRIFDLQRLGTGGPVLKFRTLLRTRLPAAASTDTTVLSLSLIAAVEVPSAVNRYSTPIGDGPREAARQAPFPCLADDELPACGGRVAAGAARGQVVGLAVASDRQRLGRRRPHPAAWRVALGARRQPGLTVAAGSGLLA